MKDSLADRLAASTLELCRVPSVTGDEKALCDLLQPRCEKLFPGAVRRVGNTLIAGRLDGTRPLVALVGHLDTVPPHPDDPPAFLDGDRVVGLGSTDMKGGVAVSLALAQDLDLPSLPYDLALVLYEREEGPYLENGLGPALKQIAELRRVRLAFCLEGTDLDLQLGCMGSLHAKVTVRGRSAHSARPWQGENAVHKAWPLLKDLAERERRRVEVDGLQFFEVVSATLAKGGRARNVVPESLELNLNYRFAPGRTSDDAEKEVVALVGGRGEIEIVDRAPSGPVAANNPLVRRFQETTGVRTTPKQAWTDVAQLGASGIDAVNFGPGMTSQAHQAREHVPSANLEKAYLALRKFLETPP